MKVERILYPTDFSEGSASALSYAKDLAKHYNAKLYIAHVVYDVVKTTGMHVPHISSEELYKELNKWGESEIEKCCAEEIREVEGYRRNFRPRWQRAGRSEGDGGAGCVGPESG